MSTALSLLCSCSCDCAPVRATMQMAAVSSPLLNETNDQSRSLLLLLSYHGQTLLPFSPLCHAPSHHQDSKQARKVCAFSLTWHLHFISTTTITAAPASALDLVHLTFDTDTHVRKEDGCCPQRWHEDTISTLRYSLASLLLLLLRLRQMMDKCEQCTSV